MGDEQESGGPRMVPLVVPEVRMNGSVAAVHTFESIYRVREKSENLCRKLADKAEINGDQAAAELWNQLTSRFSGSSIGDNDTLRADSNPNASWLLVGGVGLYRPAGERFKAAGIRAGYASGATSDEESLAVWLAMVADEDGAEMQMVPAADENHMVAPLGSRGLKTRRELIVAVKSRPDFSVKSFCAYTEQSESRWREWIGGRLKEYGGPETEMREAAIRWITR